MRIIYNKDMNALNVHQINIFQVFKLMYKAKHNLNPIIFGNTFTETHHRNPTKFSGSNFKQPKIITKSNSFVISSRKSKIWNNYLHEFEKNNFVFAFTS